MAKEKKIVYEVEVKSDKKGFDNIEKGTKKAKEGFDGVSESVENTGKAAKKSSGGLGKMAGGFKKLTSSLGIIGLFTILWNVLKDNQKVMDAVGVVMGTVSIIFNQIGSAVGNAIDKFKGMNLEFDASKKVISNLFTIALTPLKLWFLGMKATIYGAQLAWEDSFLGGGDEAKIKSLQDKLDGVKTEVIVLKDETIAAGIAIKDNMGKAITEMGEAASVVAKITKEAVVEVADNVSIASIKAANAMSKQLVQSRKNLEALEIEQEAFMLNSQQQAELQRQVRDDVSKTIEQRQVANKKLGIILDEQIAGEQKILDEKIRIARLELSADKDNHEKKMILKRLEEVESADLLERITGQRSEQIVNEQVLIKEGNDKNVDEAKKNAELLESVERNSERAKLVIQRAADEESIKNSKLSAEEKAAALIKIRDNYDADIAVMDQEIKDKKDEDDDADIQKGFDKIQEKLAQATAASDALMNLNYSQADKELTILDNKYKAKEKKLKADLESGLITQEEYDDDLITLQNDKATAEDVIKKEVFEKNKKFQIANVLMDAASAIVGTWSGYSKLGVVGTILAGIQTAAIAATAITQSSTIQAQQYTAATGGMLPGDLHAQSSGGVRLSPSVMAEGGEFIVNRASSAEYEPLLNAVNGAGNGNGDKSSVSDIIDYDKLASVINDKKVYVVSSEMSDQQNVDKAIISNSKF
jgi:hypothetical protein